MNDSIAFLMKYQKNRALNRSCQSPVEALQLARNRTSRSATGVPNVCSTRETICDCSDDLHGNKYMLKYGRKQILNIFYIYLNIIYVH